MPDPSDLPASSIVIRPMMVKDLPEVVELDRISFSLPWPESSYRFELLENTVSYCLIVESDAGEGDPHIIGVMVMWMIEDEAHIATIAIHPNHRGQGIGKALLSDGLHEATRRGMVAATLEVREHNDVAINLYRQFGFEVVGRRKRYYSDTHEDALIMTVEGLIGSTQGNK